MASFYLRCNTGQKWVNPVVLNDGFLCFQKILENFTGY